MNWAGIFHFHFLTGCRMNQIVKKFWLLCIISVLHACQTNDPAPENAEEIITIVTLNFDDLSGSNPLKFEAVDPDGDGPQNLEILDTIKFIRDTEYTLTIDLQNSLNGESISEEVREESDEHMIFFGWTDGLFTIPNGGGNIDSRDSDVQYNDRDANGLPLGLNTSWLTGSPASGTYRIVLKHQPGSKSATSTATTGETDLDITWNLSIE